MVLKNLKILRFGSAECFTHDFSEGVDIVNTRHTCEVSLALRLCLNRGDLLLPERWIRGDTLIEADLTVDQDYFRLLSRPSESQKTLVTCVYDAQGKDATGEFLRITSHCKEQDVSELFPSDTNGEILRILTYANEDVYYPSGELSYKTGGLSDIKAFRSYLRSFIRHFEPVTVGKEKQYEICIDGRGLFSVKYKGFEGQPPSLSESERILFSYLCFLRTVEFWHGFEQLRNLHGIKKPLLITDLFERIDRSVNTEDLILQTSKLDRQAIILTSNQETRYEG